ncbi:MAG: class I SAM-dependent methyltransferase [Candidatus Sumerlaeaceae bacterium]
MNSNTSQTTSAPSPLGFFEAMRGYQLTAAMKAAVELELFTVIAEGATTPAQLSSRCNASERGMRILSDFMVTCDFLTKADGQYGLTADSSVFLDKRSPAYCGGAVAFMGSPLFTELFRDMTAVVRNGGAVDPQGGTVAPDHPVWVDFARGMDPLMVPAAQVIAQQIPDSGKPMNVLDIAAGHGRFGITVAQLHPNAIVTAVDWKAVLELALENAKAAGIAERYHLLPGSAFDVEFGSDYDVVLITNFLHHFDVPTCETLLTRVHAALKPGGMAITLEFVPNDDRVTPPAAASFSLTMLGSTASGDAYTFSELEGMFDRAGFDASELMPLSGMPQSLVVSRKK